MEGRAFGIGLVTGMRSMTAAAALLWAAALGRTRAGWIPRGAAPRGLATTAAFAEIVGDKLPFAPDRRIAPSVAVRLLIGAVGGAALGASAREGAVAGAAGAVLGTLLGRAGRGGGGLARGLVEDALAVTLAVALVEGARRPA